MVGTAYLAPQPGAPPFVRLGDMVAEGQPLLDHRGDEGHEPDPRPPSGRVAQISSRMPSRSNMAPC